ncbi:hypothetical protein B0J13DRAFT_606852 [Dactylonectria estremocensis]|uniref:Uncharacterized protein n=1 Tax=Dactylonectria estremocensis TaxID=1079267 RepID=A0A9P9J8X1_9HYPO|nr:hypothetical protein B0J13DRAFT_606852 [Dactylonectria estremocensis]
MTLLLMMMTSLRCRGWQYQLTRLSPHRATSAPSRSPATVLGKLSRSMRPSAPGRGVTGPTSGDHPSSGSSTCPRSTVPSTWILFSPSAYSRPKRARLPELSVAAPRVAVPVHFYVFCQPYARQPCYEDSDTPYFPGIRPAAEHLTEPRKLGYLAYSP